MPFRKAKLCTEGECKNKRQAKGLCASHYYAAYYQANREKKQEQGSTHYRENITYHRKYARENVEQRRNWRAANPGYSRAEVHARRARKIKAGGKFTAREWQGLLTDCGHVCLCCGASEVPLEADHIRPLCLGGPSWIWNIQPLCKPCNLTKGRRWIAYPRPPKFSPTDCLD